MCGIVGAIAERDVARILIAGLKRLEYRGYDSAGIAVIHQNAEHKKTIQRIRTQGKVASLEESLQKEPCHGHIGIAHTRWATHGAPNEDNAHPHLSNGHIAVVHNGIIENYEILRQQLQAAGYVFLSETDSEVIAHLYHSYYHATKDALTAAYATAEACHGAFALGILNTLEPGRLIAIRQGSPLVIGVGIGEYFIASDSLALLPVTQQFIYLEEGDIVDLTLQGPRIYQQQQLLNRPIIEAQATHLDTERGHYRHFMEKEIAMQPEAVNATLEGRLTDQHVFAEAFGEKAPAIFDKTERIQIVACGTSYHAAMVARYWLEDLAQLPCQVEIASEFRYRRVVVEPNTLFITISQSGETADTLAALRSAKKAAYLATLSICNVPASSLVRESDLTFMTRAGTEIGVASTKAFTTQLTALFLFTLAIAERKNIAGFQAAPWIHELKNLPSQIIDVLKLNNEIELLAQRFLHKEHTLFLGRGLQYPIALEGALKLKEISYIHAEAYPAGELKHGPLALVDGTMPVVVIAPKDHLLEKLKSNLQEVKARGGELFVFADHSAGMQSCDGINVMLMPNVNPLLAPILYTIPLQLLAYHAAVLKGTDVDQPRNLAKSVTVE